jgi:hypothetical protein
LKLPGAASMSMWTILPRLIDQVRQRCRSAFDAEHALQPGVDHVADGVGLNERGRAPDAGGDVAGDPDLSSQGLGRSLFYPRPDDEESGPMAGHDLTVSRMP